MQESISSYKCTNSGGLRSFVGRNFFMQANIVFWPVIPVAGPINNGGFERISNGN
jgi:hypothetical protein